MALQRPLTMRQISCMISVLTVVHDGKDIGQAFLFINDVSD